MWKPNPVSGSQHDGKPRRRWWILAAVLTLLVGTGGLLGVSVNRAYAAQTITCNITWTQHWATPITTVPATTTFKTVPTTSANIWSCSGDPYLKSDVGDGNTFQAASAPTSASCLAGVYANDSSTQQSFWNVTGGPATSTFIWTEPSLADLTNGAKTISASYTSGRYAGGTVTIVVGGTQPEHAVTSCESSGLSDLTVTGVMTIVVP